MATSRRQARPAASPIATIGSFDRDREPCDQLRDFFQTAGIVRGNGTRQPFQAFVIARRGWQFPGNDREHAPGANGLDDVWHRITFEKPRPQPSLAANMTIWRRDGPRAWLPGSLRGWLALGPASRLKVSGKTLPDHGFWRVHKSGGCGPIRPMQAEKALLYAARSRTCVLAYSSVAQR